MVTLTYVKGLPTPFEEMTPLGLTEFEMLLTCFAPTFKEAVCEVVGIILSSSDFEKIKSETNTHIQEKYKVSKRQAGGIIALAKGKVDSARECRANHIKQLEGKLKSANLWLKRSQKRLELAQKFYAKKNWVNSKTGCDFPLSCDLETRQTNWYTLRFNIHNKKRYIYQLEKKIQHLKIASIQVKVKDSEIFIVGSKDETCGNSACQWDGNTLKFRVPYFLEEKFGKYVETQIGNFDRNINRLPNSGAKTWHFYRKDGKWVCACQFTPLTVEKVSRAVQYGAIGIDINPSSIGWAYVDFQGNLKAQGKIPLQSGLSRNYQDAQLVDACMQLAYVAITFSCPIVCENLDFSAKKEQLREKNRKYARMLSSWAYSRFFHLLESILSNRGITLLKRNPAYTSLIGLTKYSRIYGVGSDVAAAIVIARRGMNLTEKLPSSVSAYLGVNPRKHVWSSWSQFKKCQSTVIKSRHDYYSVSNWGLLVKVEVERVTVKGICRASSKRKR